MVAEKLDLMKLKPLVQNPLKGSKVFIFVKNPGTQISAIEGMIKSACFVTARWLWHLDFPCTVAKSVVYQRIKPEQRVLTPLFLLA
jgi:hypothetical protein